jgi:hypothetical protein
MDLPSRLLSLLACLALTGVASAAAPTLTNISNLTGSDEDQDTTITYADLAAAANESDGDGDTIVFRFKSLSSGTLKKNGTAVAVDGTLGAGESWVWTPDANANGTLEAFTVRAFAGGQESASDEAVDIDVAAVNDAPSFTAGANVTVNGIRGLTRRTVGLPPSARVRPMKPRRTCPSRWRPTRTPRFSPRHPR